MRHSSGSMRRRHTWPPRPRATAGLRAPESHRMPEWNQCRLPLLRAAKLSDTRYSGIPLQILPIPVQTRPSEVDIIIELDCILSTTYIIIYVRYVDPPIYKNVSRAIFIVTNDKHTIISLDEFQNIK